MTDPQRLTDAQKQLLEERGTPGLLRAHIDPKFILYPHVRLLSQKVLDAVSGRSRRQIWNLPPRYGKTMTASQATPLWFLDWWPDKRVILASYGAELAYANGRWVRNAVETHSDFLRVSLAPDSRAANRWNTPEGGGLLASGVGGAMTGFGADLLIIDDPFANWEQAASPVIRKQAWEWWRSTARTRLHAGGAIIIVQTRWHEDDLAGRLMAEDEEGIGEGWELVRLPAIAEDPDDLEETDPLRQPDPLGRSPGEPLCPQLFPLWEVQATMRAVGPQHAAGMYQQRPAPLEGDMFPPAMWVYDDPPRKRDIVGIVRRWDLAGTQDGGDYTAGVLLARTRDGRTYVLDVVRERLGRAKRTQLIVETSARDRAMFGRRVAIRIEQEPGSAGKDVGEEYVEDVLVGYHDVESIPSTGNKTVRAIPFSTAVCASMVTIAPVYEDVWVDEFVHEARDFPNGSYDDMIDAASAGYNDLRKIARLRKPVKRTTAAHLTLVQAGTA